MNKKKYMLVILLSFVLVLPTSAKKRAKPKPMKELTNPNSHSYVPFPYPKNRREIIADLKHYADVHCSSEGVKCIGQVPPTEIVFQKFTAPGSKYSVGEIVKVTNRNANMSDRYTWLIIILGPDGLPSMKVAMGE